MNYNNSRKILEIDRGDILEVIGAETVVDYFGHKELFANMNLRELLDLIGKEECKDYFDLQDVE